jgi:hypothetical protein
MDQISKKTPNSKGSLFLKIDLQRDLAAGVYLSEAPSPPRVSFGKAILYGIWSNTQCITPVDGFHHRVHIFLEMKQGYSVSAHSAGAYTATLLVMVNVMRGGRRAPPTLPARANFTLITECTPESSGCNSVYSVVSTQPEPVISSPSPLLHCINIYYCILLGPPGCAQVFPYLSPGPLDFLVV